MALSSCSVLLDEGMSWTVCTTPVSTLQPAHFRGHFRAATLEIQSKLVTEKVVGIEVLEPEEEYTVMKIDEELRRKVKTPVKGI